ncbi:MAG: hypothetical protein PHP45_11065 [Elusimicrobiales bacterium]|nr:hypothetical protein [Elusimicrobiales bacterium]
MAKKGEQNDDVSKTEESNSSSNQNHKPERLIIPGDGSQTACQPADIGRVVFKQNIKESSKGFRCIDVNPLDVDVGPKPHLGKDGHDDEPVAKRLKIP